MFVTLYVFGADFQMISYDSKEEAIREVQEHFNELAEKNQYDPETDEAFVFETVGNRKDMVCVYSTRNVE